MHNTFELINPSRSRANSTPPRAATSVASTFAVMVGLMGAPGMASAAPTPFINQATNTCLSVQGASTANAATLVLSSCNNAVNQLWDLTTFKELRVYGHQCLDSKGWGTAPGTPAQSYVCNGFDNQKWSFLADGSIKSDQSGLCLQVGSTGSATTTTCNGSAAQKWRRGPAAAGAAPDTTAPTAPSGLSISGLTCKSVDLSWAASRDNVGLAVYDVYHDGQKIATVPAQLRTVKLALVPSVTWGLYVVARDGTGNASQASATLSLKVPACSVDTQPPSTPTALSATVAGTAVTLKWTASTDNVGVKSYLVFRNGVQVALTPTTTYTDSGLAANTTYTYAVRAADAAGLTSPASVSVTAKTAGGCVSPICGVTELASESDLPWGLVTLADGNVLYSRRDTGDIMLLNTTTKAKSLVGAVPNSYHGTGEGGLLGLAALPGFPNSDPWLYIMHTTTSDNRVVRMRYANGRIDTASLQVLVKGIARNNWHNGGRLRFGPDGKLYAATGDAQNDVSAQDTNSLNGKVLRFNQDGSVPSDNPFGNYVWSYGHRNPQGLAFDAQGRLWEQEFGGGIMDETNLIVKGANYGWPRCEGTSGSCTGFTAPKLTYPVADGSCSGIAIVREKLYVACQRGTRMYRADISGTSLVNVQQLLVGTYGRLRTVEPSLDGNLFLTTTNSNGSDKVFKVTLGN